MIIICSVTDMGVCIIAVKKENLPPPNVLPTIVVTNNDARYASVLLNKIMKK